MMINKYYLKRILDSQSSVCNTMSTWGYNKDNGELTNFYYLIMACLIKSISIYAFL